MLKIRLVPTKEGVHVANDNTPASLSVLRCGCEVLRKIENILRSLSTPEGHAITTVTFESNPMKVDFYAQSVVGDTPVFLKEFPFELLEYLKEVELIIAKKMS